MVIAEVIPQAGVLEGPWRGTGRGASDRAAGPGVSISPPGIQGLKDALTAELRSPDGSPSPHGRAARERIVCCVVLLHLGPS